MLIRIYKIISNWVLILFGMLWYNMVYFVIICNNLACNSMNWYHLSYNMYNIIYNKFRGEMYG